MLALTILTDPGHRPLIAPCSGDLVQRSRLFGMRRLVMSLAVLSSYSCGGSEAHVVPDASTDAATDAASMTDAPPDGPPVYCSSMCGLEPSLDVPEVGPIDVCDPGEFCGNTGGVAGYICCPAGARVCNPSTGQQHGYGCP
jgi:hypothetical protein